MNGEPERHNPPLAMFSADAAEHEQVVARFEQAHARGEQPQIEEYLVGEGDERHALLLELVHVDREMWGAVPIIWTFREKLLDAVSC